MINIDILKPQCRLDDLWVRVITKNDVDLPLPQSRLELYVTALITGNIDNLPYPQSRVEMLLYCILTDTEYTFNAQSRVEMFLKAIITLDIEGLPTPMSRLEWYLDYIVRNGCLEKYEYYPFNIWSYLNVKNTPKARMKFKNIKGNTLVNIIDNSKIGQLAYSDGWINVSSSNSWQRSDIIPGNKKYTVFYEFVLSEDITFDSDNYNQFIRVDNVSNGSVVNDSARFVGNSYKANVVNRYMFILNEAYDTKLVIRNGIQKNFKCRFFISEGDHTQNPPPYFEGMKSFGESENKIEVLSDNNLQGELNQSSKATLMYRNSSNKLVPIPILRGKWENGKFLWGDEILLHEDGQLYYHKRCEEYLLNGTELWMLFPGDSTNPRSFYYSLLPGYKFSFDFMVDNRPMIKSKTQDGCWRFDSTDIKIAISDNQSTFATIADFQQHIKENNLRVVLQLPYEEVYPCELTEQLYSFDGETNIFISGGAVVGETVIEVGTKLGPIVATLKQETLRNARAVEGLLAHGVQEMAYQLYPEDFNKPNEVEMKPIEPVE